MARTNLVQDCKSLSRRGRLVFTLVMTGTLLIFVIGFLSAGIVKRLPRDWKNATCTVIEDPRIIKYACGKGCTCYRAVFGVDIEPDSPSLDARHSKSLLPSSHSDGHCRDHKSDAEEDAQEYEIGDEVRCYYVPDEIHGFPCHHFYLLGHYAFITYTDDNVAMLSQCRAFFALAGVFFGIALFCLLFGIYAIIFFDDPLEPRDSYVTKSEVPAVEMAESTTNTDSVSETVEETPTDIPKITIKTES